MSDWAERQAARVRDLCARTGVDYERYLEHPHLLVLPLHRVVTERLAADQSAELEADLTAWLTDHLCREHPVRIAEATGPNGPIHVLVHHESGINPEALVAAEVAEPPVLPQRILGVAEELLELTIKDCGC